MKTPVGFRAIAVELPRTRRTNDYWRMHHPSLVEQAEHKTLARLFATTQQASGDAAAFDAEMAPFLSDPFRGAVERRVLGPGETSLSMELGACRQALAAAGMSPRDVDLAIVTSFLPDQPGVGNATFIARDLGLRCPAWNLESACSSALVAVETAAALIRASSYKNVLVVLSCSYSRDTEVTDTLSWFMGDAAGAFVLGPVDEGYGLLGHHTVNTVATCGTFYHDLIVDPVTGPRPRLQCTRETQRILRETSEGYVRACCEGAARAAGTTIADVDFFVFNTPTAWFADFCVRTLSIAKDRTLTTYPMYANAGPALMPLNLHHAAATGRIRKGDRVCIYTIGSVSTASAAIVRWGDVGVGPLPPPAADA